MRDNLISTLRSLFPGRHDHAYELTADIILEKLNPYTPVTRVAHDLCNKTGPAIEGHEIAVITSIKSTAVEYKCDRSGCTGHLATSGGQTQQFKYDTPSEKLQSDLEPLP